MNFILKFQSNYLQPPCIAWSSEIMYFHNSIHFSDYWIHLCYFNIIFQIMLFWKAKQCYVASDDFFSSGSSIILQTLQTVIFIFVVIKTWSWPVYSSSNVYDIWETLEDSSYFSFLPSFSSPKVGQHYSQIFFKIFSHIRWVNLTNNLEIFKFHFLPKDQQNTLYIYIYKNRAREQRKYLPYIPLT